MRFCGISFVCWLSISSLAYGVVREWDDGGATSDWTEAANWSPDGVPDNPDDVIVGSLVDAYDDVVLLDISDTVNSLTLENGSDFDTNGRRIVVGTNTFVGTGAGSGTSPSQLIVRPRGGIAQFAVDTNTLTIGSNGQLTLLDSEVDVDGTGGAVDGVLSVAAGGAVHGFGLIQLSDFDAQIGAATDLLVNDGAIVVEDPTPVVGEPPAVTLAITAPNAPLNSHLKLGGTSGLGTVTVTRNATLELGTSYTGPESLILLANSTLLMHGDGELPVGSTVEVNSGVANPGGPNELPQAPAMITGAGVLSTSGVIRVNRADEELIIESRIDAVAGTITNRGVIRFRGGGGLRGVNFNTFDDGVVYNESNAILNFQGGNTYDTPLINGGLMGVLANGSATATVGDFSQTQDGTLAIDLGGILVDEFDVLSVDGDANLDGTLQVDLINGFEPALGNMFEILTTPNGTVSGTFDMTNFPALSGLAFDVVYNPQSVVLEVVANSTAGDFDNDGDVDGADFLKWQRDGLSASELLEWQNNYNPPPELTAVPEPNAGLLLILAAMFIPCCSRR